MIDVRGFLPWDSPGSRRFAFGSLKVFGQPFAKYRRRRALLFSDSYGPTVQVNFIRPLTAFCPDDAWGTWTIVERRRGQLESDESIRTTAQDLERIFATFRPAVVIASRYGGPLASAIVTLSRDRRIPLVAHLDDNLFDVPVSAAGAANRHRSAQRQVRLKALLAAADLDLISTAALHQILDPLGVLGPRRMIAKIAGAATVVGKPNHQLRRRMKFGYMGTKSHAADLAMVAPAIRRLLEAHPDSTFELFGSIEAPAELSGFDIRHHTKIPNYGRFLRRLSSLDWAFGIAPLQLTPFTLAKTNIKWIEYTAAGIPVIASDHPIYRECCGNGAGVLAGPEDWYGAMSELLSSRERRASFYAAARAKLLEEYTPARMYRQLMEAFTTAGVSLE